MTEKGRKANGTGTVRAKSAMANAAWNTFGTLCTIATAFAAAPLLIRYLGVAGYGTLLLLGSVLGILGVMNFGLGEATLRYVARYYAAQDFAGVNRVFGSTLTFYAVVGLTVAGAMAAGAPVVVSWLAVSPSQREAVAALFRVAGIVFALGMMASAYSVVPSALQRYDISTKVGIAVNFARTAGYVVLAALGYDLLALISWDLALGIWVLTFRATLAKRLLPTLNLLPSLSFAGLRETVGYSMFAFLTWAVHTAHRESGKMLLGRISGMAPVAYLGTPDNIAQRLHMVIASGSEALVPKFSADCDPKTSEPVFWRSTWSATALSLMLFIPFVVLVPDFLRLWISPEFARESGTIGRVLGIYLISQSAFAPVAAYFRGSGKPWYVTLVIAAALIITVSSSLYLIPRLGALGAGYAYLAGSAAPLTGVLAGGIYAFGVRSAPSLARAVVVPIVAGAVACGLSAAVRSYSGELSWAGLILHAAFSLVTTSALVLGSNWVSPGADSFSRQLVHRITGSRKFKAISHLIPVRQSS